MEDICELKFLIMYNYEDSVLKVAEFPKLA